MTGRALLRCAGLLAAILTTTAAAPAAHAQESPQAALAAADVTITMAADGPDTVSSRFRLSEPAGAATEVPVLLLGRGGVELGEVTPGAGVADVQATSAGERWSVMLEPGAQEYVLEHTVHREQGTRAVPLLVPEIDTSRQAEVRISVRLPDGQRLVGDSMPTFDEVAGAGGAVTVEHVSGALPSVVVADYGTGTRVGLGTVLSALGVGFLVVLSVLWFRHSAREEARTA